MPPPPPPRPSLILLPFLFLLLPLLSTSSPATETTALLNLKSTLHSPNPSLFSTWLPSSPSPCSFSGVTCHSSSVTSLDLSHQNLQSTSPLPLSSLCTSLPSLQSLSLSFNSLSYPLPPSSLLNCSSLLLLDLSSNLFSGPFPNFSSSPLLQHLFLNLSGFSGPFPFPSLSSTPNLQSLSIGDNPFSPTPFPDVITTLSRLTALTNLYMSNCSLSGSIPNTIGNLVNLENLELSDNSLTGEIPPGISQLNKLWQIELYNNHLVGTIPAGFGNLTKLRFFDASQNGLTGGLSEIRTLTNLVSLQLFENELSGEVPVELGEFRNLVNVSLYNNNLTGELPQKLGSWSEFNFIDVSTNGFTGPIPPDMCKKGTMKKLLILQNQFSGEIPASYGSCRTLVRFRVSQNLLTGTVPAGIWGLPNAVIIDIEGNLLEGPITAEIGKATSLGELYAANNRLAGSLPAEISGATELAYVDLSGNQLNGQIPETVGELKALNVLYLQCNRFSGDIPDSLGSCVRLVDLSLARNSISGQIPGSLGSLPGLTQLNLSSNDLSGEIPSSLSLLRLNLLDLSYNDLNGPIPESLTIGAYNSSFLGNQGLCSPNGRLLKQCGSGEVRTFIICLVIGCAVVIGLAGCYAYLKIKAADKERGVSFKDGSSWDMKSYHVLSFTEGEILDSVQEDNLVGKGGCGSVYKATLKDGQELAVKHILTVNSGGHKKIGQETPMLSRTRRSKEFDAEVGLLSSIRHVNVVKLFCSITSEDSSLLVYEYLPNGSLWDRMHSCKKLTLDWTTRHEIALGAARGLEYLHHGCERPVLHRDIKSSNILLDELLKPKIADFGLAKIVQTNVGMESTHVIAGTHGYIAPEYGYTYKVNEKSDVYSFGVVLMELVTGKRPIEAEFGENKDIVSWVSNNLKSKESVLSMVDTSIPEPIKEEAIKVLKIAILCTTRLPDLRPSMRSVVQMLEDADPCKLEAIVISKNGSVKKAESP